MKNLQYISFEVSPIINIPLEAVNWQAKPIKPLFSIVAASQSAHQVTSRARSKITRPLLAKLRE